MTDIIDINGKTQADALDNIDEPSYHIVRFYRDDDERNRTIIETGLTLAEAQAHCKDPETSSSTATSPQATAHTDEFGPWFDGYEEE